MEVTEISPNAITSTPCVPATPGGQGWNCVTNHITTTMSLPANPGDGRPECDDMQVEYDFRFCVNSQTGKIDVAFWNFSAMYGASCTAFDAWYQALTPQQKTDAQDKWEYDASLLQELSQNQYVVDLICPYVPLPLCPTLSGTSTFMRVNCYARCLVPCNDCPNGVDVIKYTCGEECCKRTRDFCVSNSSCLIYFLEPSFQVVGPSCGGPPQNPCPGGIPLGTCGQHDCGPK